MPGKNTNRKISAQMGAGMARKTRSNPRVISRMATRVMRGILAPFAEFRMPPGSMKFLAAGRESRITGSRVFLLSPSGIEFFLDVLPSRRAISRSVKPFGVGDHHHRVSHRQIPGIPRIELLAIGVHEPVSYTHLRAHETDSYLV